MDRIKADWDDKEYDVFVDFEDVDEVWDCKDEYNGTIVLVSGNIYGNSKPQIVRDIEIYLDECGEFDLSCDDDGFHWWQIGVAVE
jgi:hypothetical protein